MTEKFVRVEQDAHEDSEALLRCELGVTGDGFKVGLELLWTLAVNRLFFAMVMDRLTDEVR